MSRPALITLLASLLAPGCGGTATYLYETARLPPAELDGRGLQITWLGVAGLLISDGETSLLIDPFVSRYGLLRVGLGDDLPPRFDEIDAWVRRLRPRNVRAVIVSHSHYDHSLDAPFFALRTGAVLLGCESAAQIGRGAGLPEGRIRVVHGGDSLQLGAFRVSWIQSVHGPALLGRIPYPGTIDAPLVPPAPASAYRLGETFTLLIEHPRGRLLHHASAGHRPGMFAGVRADTVLLGLAGRGDTRRYLEHIPAAVGARRIIPIHFDDMFAPLEPDRVGFLIGVRYAEFIATVRRQLPQVEVVTLPIGQPVQLDSPSARTRAR